MWFLLIIKLSLTSSSTQIVENVVIAKRFETQQVCQQYIDNIPATQIPMFTNLGCVHYNLKGKNV